MTRTLRECASVLALFTAACGSSGNAAAPDGSAGDETPDGSAADSSSSDATTADGEAGRTGDDGGLFDAHSESGRPFADPLASLIASPAPPGAADLGARMALNVHDAENLDAVTAAGFHHVRADTGWKSIEKTKGVYDFASWIDPAWSAFSSRNIVPLWLLDYGNPLYGDQADSFDYDISSDASQQAFVNFAVALVNHLPKGQWWEVWNEPAGFSTMPVSRFASVCQAVAQAIHAADPTAKVVTGGNAGYIDTDYLDSTLTVGGGAGADGIGMHMYQYPTGSMTANADPEQLFDSTRPDSLAGWEAVKSKYSISAPTWDTEGGYCSDDGPSGDANWHPRMVVRYLLTAWSAGLPLFVLYDKDDACYGLLGHATTLKAVTTLSQTAAGRSFTGFTLPADASKLHLLRMEGPSDVVYVLWMRTGTFALDVPSGTPGFTMVGDAFTTTSSLVVDASAGPVYVKFVK